MSVVLLGSTSGSITLQEPAVSGSTVLDLPNTSGSLVVTSGAQTVQFGAGSASAPSVTFTGDTNTGIFSPGADSIAFSEGGVESMRIDSSGRVGIGTTTPNIYGVSGSLLAVSSSTSYSFLALAGSSGNGGAIDFGNQTIRHAEIASLNGSALAFYTNGTDSGTGLSERMRIDSAGRVGIGNAASAPGTLLTLRDTNDIVFVISKAGVSGFDITNAGTSGVTLGTQDPYHLAFKTNNSERMRVDTSGNLLIGVTSGFGVAQGFQASATGNASLALRRLSDSGHVARFLNFNSTQVGSIGVDGSSTSYNTSSDYRLKENIAPMTGALAKVSLLKPVTYKWKVDDSDGQGFIAHELAEVVPEAVSGEKDDVDAEGNPIHQGVDTSFLVATLTAAIQEQQAIINELKARIETLENS